MANRATRCQREWEMVSRSTEDWFSVSKMMGPDGNELKFSWMLHIMGPTHYAMPPTGSDTKEGEQRPSPYAGGVFMVRCDFPAQYPSVHPDIKFQNKVYHPNIAEDGKVCVDFWKDKWDPKKTVLDVMLVLRTLLAQPNPDDAVVSSIATQMNTDLPAFEAECAKWTKQYADPGNSSDGGSGGGDDDDDDL